MKTFTASHLSHKPAEVFEEARTNGAIIQQKRTNGDVVEEFLILKKSDLTNILLSNTDSDSLFEAMCDLVNRVNMDDQEPDMYSFGSSSTQTCGELFRR